MDSKVFMLLLGLIALCATKMLNFSGKSWYIRNNSLPQGPGPNYFSDANSSVYVDASGLLHMKIVQSQNNWLCSQIFTNSSGYGTYAWTVQQGFENIDINAVLGLFTYLDDYHEIDIELAKWGYAQNANAQYAVQPASISANVQRFNLTNNNMPVVLAYTWQPGYVFFQSFYANSISNVQSYFGKDLTPASLFNKWNYTGPYTPAKSTQKVHINFWLTQGKAPSSNVNQQVIIKEFKYFTFP